MSRLSRLRSFWRSLRRGTVRDGSYKPHAAVNLLPQEYRTAGTPQERGSWVLSASTGTKEHGTRTPATATSVAFSSWSPRGVVSAVIYDRTGRLRVNSSTDHYWFGDETAAPGASGAPRRPAV